MPGRSLPKIAPGQLPPPNANENGKTQGLSLATGNLTPTSSPKKALTTPFTRKLSNGLEESDSESSDNEMIIEDAKSLVTTTSAQPFKKSAADNDDPMIIEEAKPDLPGSSQKRKSDPTESADPFAFTEPESVVSQAKRVKTEFSLDRHKATSKKQIPVVKPSPTKYRHTWNDVEKSVEKGNASGKPSEVAKDPFEFHDIPGPSLMSSKLKKVHNPQAVLEEGERAVFSQDLEYFLAIANSSTASESAIYQGMQSLIKKAVKSDFRKFLRRGNALSSFFGAIKSHMNSPRVAATAAVFVLFLSRDRPIFNIDENFTILLPSMLKTKQDLTDPDFVTAIATLWPLIEEWTRVTSDLINKRINLNMNQSTFSVYYITLEALALLCVQKRDIFFQNQLHDLGILQWIIQHVEKLTKKLSKNNNGEGISSSLRELHRCMRILEAGCLRNAKNQAYMMTGGNFSLLQSCTSLFKIFQKFIMNTDETNRVMMFDPICAIGRLLMNMTHENELCCTKLAITNDFLQTSFNYITEICPKYAPKDKGFDATLMCLALLVNIAEKSNSIRSQLIKLTARIYKANTQTVEEQSAIVALTNYFIFHESAARTIDEELDRQLELDDIPEDDEVPEETRGNRELSEAEALETAKSAIAKADTHMEDSILASYYGVLLGCLIQRDTTKAMEVKEMMPNESFTLLIEQLTRFKEFMETTHKGANLSNLTRIIGTLQGYSAL